LKGALTPLAPTPPPGAARWLLAFGAFGACVGLSWLFGMWHQTKGDGGN